MSQDNNNHNYNDIGVQIKDSVMQAVNSGDFSGLSDSISRTVTSVLGDVGDSINQAASQVNARSANQATILRKQAEARARAQAEAARFRAEQQAKIDAVKRQRAQNVRKPANIIRFNEVGSSSAILLNIVGVFLFFSALGMITEGAVATIIGALITAGVAFICFGIGGGKQKLLKKARKIRSLCLNKSYCTVDEIASATGCSRDKAIKLIRQILDKGFFPEGYVDDEMTTFMASRSVYDQYLETKKNHMVKSQELTQASLKEQGINEEASSNLTPEQQSELNQMMRDGYASIKKLHDLNEQIPGQVITEKLYVTEGLLNDIFARVKNEPSQMKNCHKLMDYHLPTVLKLVEAYAEYDKITSPGPEIVKAKEEIEKTLDLINQAFTELLNRLFQDSVWDITSDAQVLKSMLTQEGLAKDI